MQLIYCQMTQNRLSETRACIERALPYVDHIVIVDGGSIDESIFYFSNWAREEKKIHFYLHPWEDNFPKQRTNYLKHADKFAKPGDFILVSDPDELFEETAMKAMKRLCQKILDNGQWNSASFQCRSVSLRGNKRVWEHLDHYWKHLLYKWHPGMHYVGNPHETIIMQDGFQIVQTDLVYEHIKQDNVIFLRGMRNFTIGGGGPNLGDKNPIWIEWKKVCKDNNIPTKWHDHEKYLIAGNIHQSLKDWMIKYHNVNGFDGSSEVRECYKTYFRIFHPEEEPEHLRGKYIP